MCSAAGSISGWKETDADLRGSVVDPQGENQAIAVSVQALAILRDIARKDPSLIPLAYRVEVENASQPILRVTVEESLRYGAIVIRHSMLESSQRRCGVLADLAGALAKPSDEQSHRSDFIELGSATSEVMSNLLPGLSDSRDPEFVPVRPRPTPREDPARS